MELELKEMSQTLVLGGFAIYGILNIFRLLTGYDWRTAQKKETSEKPEPEPLGSSQPLKKNGLEGNSNPKENWSAFKEAALYLSFALAAGLFCEDISKNFTAERDGYKPQDGFLAAHITCLMDTHKGLRFRSLISEKFNTNCNCALSLLGIHEQQKDSAEVMVYSEKPLCRALIKLSEQKDLSNALHVVTNVIPNISTNMVTNVITGDIMREFRLDDHNRSQIAAKINDTYYEARNCLFREEAPSELKGLEDRVDFTRAFALVCGVFLLIYTTILIGILLKPGPINSFPIPRGILITMFVGFLAYIITATSQAPRTSANVFTCSGIYFCWLLALVCILCLQERAHKNKQLIDESSSRIKHATLFILVCFLGFGCALVSYKTQQEKVNERIFGYYISLKTEVKPTPNEASHKSHDHLVKGSHLQTADQSP
jgi:hypothetical protein